MRWRTARCWPARNSPATCCWSQSEFDHLIPPAVISNYREACVQARSLTYRVMRGADHGLTEESMSRAYTTLLFNWLREMVFAAERSTSMAPTGSG